MFSPYEKAIEIGGLSALHYFFPTFTSLLHQLKLCLACVFLVKSMYFIYILNSVFSGENMQFRQILHEYCIIKALYLPQILHENTH